MLIIHHFISFSSSFPGSYQIFQLWEQQAHGIKGSPFLYTLFPEPSFSRLTASDVRVSSITFSFVLVYTIILVAFQHPQS